VSKIKLPNLEEGKNYNNEVCVFVQKFNKKTKKISNKIMKGSFRIQDKLIQKQNKN
jgi:hypothetical protein